MTFSLKHIFSNALSAAIAVVAMNGALASAADMPRVEGEYAKPSAATTKALAILPLKGTYAMQSDFAALELPPMDSAQIESIKKSNSSGMNKKAMQIGIARSMRTEAPDADASPALRLKNIASNGKVAYLRIKSGDAKAIRVGLKVLSAPSGLELRFVGGDSPTEVVAFANANEVLTSILFKILVLEFKRIFKRLKSVLGVVPC